MLKNRSIVPGPGRSRLKKNRLFIIRNGLQYDILDKVTVKFLDINIFVLTKHGVSKKNVSLFPKSCVCFFKGSIPRQVTKSPTVFDVVIGFQTI